MKCIVNQKNIYQSEKSICPELIVVDIIPGDAIGWISTNEFNSKMFLYTQPQRRLLYIPASASNNKYSPPILGC
jgi:hypothetical protein